MVAELPPPAPEQANEKLVVTESARVEVLPLVCLAPLQPPEAAQAVAFVELQTSVVVVPGPMVVGMALRVTVAGALVTISELTETGAAAKRLAATSLPINTCATANFFVAGESEIFIVFGISWACRRSAHCELPSIIPFDPLQLATWRSTTPNRSLLTASSTPPVS